jgi:hypothetical protein
MWTSTPRSRTAHTTRSRGPGLVVALLACFGLASCTATEASAPASTAEAGTIAPFPQSGAIDAGTYLVTGYSVPFEITITDGWETFDGASLGKDDPDLPNSWNVALFFYPVTYVPTDACAWMGALVEIGPTAEAFVVAMAAQSSTESTSPVDVMVGDYSGLEFDHTAEADSDLAGCDTGRLCAWSDLPQDCNGSAFDTGGERLTYRAVDLNGERAVIGVYRDQSIDPGLAKEARAIFDSIEFVGPEE